MPKHARPRPQPVASESRAVELLTHAWMLSVVTVLACEVAATAAALGIKLFAPSAAALGLFAGFMLFAALVSGVISLAMLALVLWMRRVAPPRMVILVAALAGIAPLVVIVLRAMF